MEDNIVSECIRTVAVAMYAGKILQLNEYEANAQERMSTDTKRSANESPKLPVHAT